MAKPEIDPSLEFDEADWSAIEVSWAESMAEVGGDVLRCPGIDSEFKQTVLETLQFMYELYLERGEVEAAGRIAPVLAEFLEQPEQPAGC